MSHEPEHPTPEKPLCPTCGRPEVFDDLTHRGLRVSRSLVLPRVLGRALP